MSVDKVIQAFETEVGYLKKRELLSLRDAEKKGDLTRGRLYRVSVNSKVESLQRMIKDMKT